MSSSPTRLLRAAVLVGGLVTVAAACSGDDTASTSDTVAIQPSSYVVKDPVTTTTLPSVPTPDGEGRSPVEQSYTVREGDYPITIADLYDVDVDELRGYNGWDEDFGDFPNAGGTVRIPPEALYVDPNAVTTTTAPTEESGATTEETTPGSTNPDDCAPGAYAIEDGDNPTMIAEKFDVTLEALTAANGWDAQYSNFGATGDTVVIPPPTDCTTPTT